MSINIDNKQIRLCNLEAALYAAGRPLNYEEIMPLVKTKSERVVKKIIRSLKEKYQKRDYALEIVNLQGRRVTLQLKEKYDFIVNNFNYRPLLSKGPLKTLSYIAFHQPIDQKTVIECRGSHVYPHLKMMENMGLITRERTGDRGHVIKTTSFFGYYFGFSPIPNRTKLQLKQVFKDLKLSSLENDNNNDENSQTRDGTKRLRELLADSQKRYYEELSENPSSTNK